MRIPSSSVVHLRVPVIHVTTRGYRTAAPRAWQARKSTVQYGYKHGCGIVKRQIHLGQVLMPPLIFTGLFLALWCYKCIMLVLFQNAIIYNPFLPPNARSMTISEFSRQCGGVEWKEDRIKSLDGTEIALCISEISCGDERGSSSKGPKTPVYILYFQGMLIDFRLKLFQLAEWRYRERFISSPSTARSLRHPTPAESRDQGTSSLHHDLSQLQGILDVSRSAF